MKVFICSCDDCGWTEYFRYNAGPPKSCGSCNGPIYFEEANIDPESIGEDILGEVARRPSWYPGRQKEIRERRMSRGGTIYCGLCDKPIIVNADGKEEWESFGGNQHATLPHTDHVDPWKDRAAKLYASPEYRNATPAEQMAMEREVFNASPLQVTHMSCNCSKGADEI